MKFNSLSLGRILGISSALLALSITPASAAVQLASSSRSAYMLPDSGLWTTVAVLSAGDAAANGYRMAGIPDGLGAFDNNDGTFTLLMNHELSGTVGITRAHGARGAFVSRWVIRKDTLAVVSGEDQIKRVKSFDRSTGVWRDATPSELIFSRFCSADLPAATAFFNAATGLGTQNRIFMNGEESGTEGRGFAHILTGTEAGTSYELPYTGKAAFENLVANPFAQDKTVVMATDDSTPGYVYLYVGTKRSTGNDIEKAGLVGGILYGVKVTGMTTETNTQFTTVERTRAFTVANFGDVSRLDGATLRSNAAGAAATQFNRPEDGAWNPAAPNEFYFVTTNAFGAATPTRLWRLTFTNLASPELGGTLELMWDGSYDGDGTARMFDNLTVNSTGQVMLQEDPGNQTYVARMFSFDIAKRTLRPVASHTPGFFQTGGANFLTVDEESSGIIDVSGLLGSRDNYLFVTQAHTTATTANVPAGANPTELAELGQLMLLTPSTRSSGWSSRGRVTATDPMIAGFVVGGTEPKTVLIRTQGPTLSAFGLTGVLANPKIQVVGGTVNVENLNWKTNANAAAITATGLSPTNDNEAALLLTLHPGVYSVVVRDEAGGSGGVALVEAFESDTQPGQTQARLTSLSARATVGPAEQMLIAGFVVEGREPRRVLVRALGPTIGALGVPGAIADTNLRVFRGATQIASNGDFAQDTASVAQFAATPGLRPGNSAESSLVLTLEPGVYTAVVDGANGATGTALLDLTDL